MEPRPLEVPQSFQIVYELFCVSFDPPVDDLLRLKPLYFREHVAAFGLGSLRLKLLLLVKISVLF